MDTVITSPTNPRVKRLVALRRPKVRLAEGTTLVEGFEELTLALNAGATARVLYVCPQLWSPSGMAGSQEIGHQDDVVRRVRAGGGEIVHLSRAAFEKAAYREGADGLLAEVASVQTGLDRIDVPADALVLLVEAVEKPGNLGAMLRTADAAGVTAVVSVDGVTDWANPNVVRSSKGTVFSLPVATATVDEVLAWCARYSLSVVVTTPETDVLYADADYTGPTAVVVGSEKHGVSDRLLAAATQRIRIPMLGKANSLNVGVSAAVVLYEAVRQRSGPREGR